MTSYLIVPGWGGSSAEHWQSQWQPELPRVSRLDVPDWFNPRPAEWLAALDRAIRDAPEPPIVLAHSLGCIAVARWAARAPAGIRGALLVAPPDLDRVDAAPVLTSFAPVPRSPLPFPSLVVASDDDPYASLSYSARLAREWGAELTVLHAAGHINRDSGYGPWPEGRALLRYFAEPARPPSRYEHEGDDAPWIQRGLD